MATIRPTEVARKGSRPVHRVVWNKVWQVRETACGVGVSAYRVTEEDDASSVTCRSCLASTR